MKSRHARVLVVDDDHDVTQYLVESLQERGFDAQGTTSANEALRIVGTTPQDLVITDLVMPEMRGTDLVRRIHAIAPEQLVMIMTAFGDIEQAATALREGACDFIPKPFTLELLLHSIDRALRERQMKREIVRLSEVGKGVLEATVRSAAMRRVLDIAMRAARTDVTVLVTGESGTGKGVVAELIHAHSNRSEGPFVRINCAALPPALAESELFGVRRGAFTDAKEDRPGLFVEAGAGTLFLDEIGDLPEEIQPKLLHALETGRVRAVGDTRERPFSARLIAATNLVLEDAVRDGTFRADLYHRLNVVRIEVPPLRERLDDLPLLVDDLLARAVSRTGSRVKGVSASAMRWMMSYTWPGNIRELANTLERAVALAEHDVLLLEDVRPRVLPPGPPETLDDLARARTPLARLEMLYARRVLQLVGGNKTEAARVLGIDRRTLYRKLEEWPDGGEEGSGCDEG